MSTLLVLAGLAAAALLVYLVIALLYPEVFL
jgi:hypothetical protein